MQAVKVTVVIPTYNRSDLVLEAIKSCFSDNTPDNIIVAVVVVDDGSTDNTEEKIRIAFQLRPVEFYQTNNQVFYLKISNSERGAARNRGAEFAIHKLQTDWLIFLDADDIFTKDCFEQVAPYLESQDYLVSAKYLLWDGLKTLGFPRPATPAKPLTTLEALQLFLSRSHIAISTTFFPAATFLAIGGFSENRQMSGSEDWLFLAKSTLQLPIKYVEKIIHLYRQHDGNTKPERTESAIEALHSELKPFLEKYLGKSSRKYFKKCFFKHQLMIVGAYNSQGKNSVAWKKMANLIKSNPLYLFRSETFWVLLSLSKRKFFNNTSQ